MCNVILAGEAQTDITIFRALTLADVPMGMAGVRHGCLADMPPFEVSSCKRKGRSGLLLGLGRPERNESRT